VDPDNKMQVLNPELTITIGPQDIPVGMASFNARQHVPFNNHDKQDFNIFFSAKNGLWTELFRLRRINGNREIAIKVEGRPGMNVPFSTHKLYEQISKDFPRSELDPNWRRTFKPPSH
jgi:hypothetical protein